MKSLVYLSHNSGMMEDELNFLIDSFKMNNKHHAVTGCLLERHGVFIQYLEGPAESVERLFTVIQQDSRHRVLLTLDRKIKKRRFPHWHMQLLNSATQVEDILHSKLHKRLLKAKRAKNLRLRSLFHFLYTNKVWRAIDTLAAVTVLSDINAPKDRFRY